MARVTVYLDEETKKRVLRAAKAAGVSQSRWLRELVRQKTASEWPSAARELAGAWPDFLEAKDLRRGVGRNARRERF